MAVRYVTTDDFDAVSDARTALFASGGSYSSTLFNRAAELASELARSAAKNAGHDLPTDTDGTVASDFVRALTLSFLVHMAYGRNHKEVPASLGAILAPLPEAVRVGDLPVVGDTPTTLDAVGGVKFTDRSTTSADGRPPLFRDLGKVR